LTFSLIAEGASADKRSYARHARGRSRVKQSLALALKLALLAAGLAVAGGLVPKLEIVLGAPRYFPKPHECSA
jgi:hypothetical protein